MIANDITSTSYVVLAAVDFLKDLHDRAEQPADARRLLRHFQDEHPDVQLEMVADEEAYEQSFHYDLLVRFGEQESISLSYCHDHGIPWAMRGARRWTERDLLRVNDVVLRVDDALGCIEFDWNDASAMQTLVNVCILREALERDLVHVSPDELQQSLDAFRLQRGLHRADDTHAWLVDRGVSHSQLEGIAFQRAMVAKFRTQIVAEKIEPYFQDHHSEFDTAAVAMILYRERAAAQVDIDQICRGEISFYSAAERSFLDASGPGSMGTAAPPTFTRLRRGSLPLEFSTAVFSAATDEVVGPLRFGDSWAAVRHLATTPATLDDPTRNIIEETLFERWLEKQRATAQIEWYWGNAKQTGMSSK